MDKARRTITIADLFKKETLFFDEVGAVEYEVKIEYKPNMKFSNIILHLKNGEKRTCFTVRSDFPLDLGEPVLKDLHAVSERLTTKIRRAILG